MSAPNRNRGSADHILLSEAAETIAAALDIAVRASAPSVPLAEALRLRRVARAQLDVAGKLLFAVRHGRPIMDHEKASAAGLPDGLRSGRLISSGGSMSRYDQPGFAGEIPGLGMVDAGSLSNCQGSDSPGEHAGNYQDTGASLGTVPVSRPYDSVAAGIPMVEQTTGSTNSAIDPMLDRVSGARTPPPVPPGGRVWAPRGKGAGD